MSKEIINRVTNSKLVTIDLEDYYPKGERHLLDIKNWLHEELFLKEKDFRASINDFDWTKFNDGYVAVFCSSGAIIPTWAYLLIATKLKDNCIINIVGNLDFLENFIFLDLVNSIDLAKYDGKAIVIKGCSKKNIPLDAYSQLINRLKPIAKRIMFGEACSTVPLYKKEN
ncbi:DUF2480 family protein [Flavobacteriaceae bacterium]|nr:DUF2480 family protein [Flavobacteriaceae bacterium]MDC1492351.1 DUF2480 family protein [Flavobacteriaceae bacterium]